MPGTDVYSVVYYNYRILTITEYAFSWKIQILSTKTVLEFNAIFFVTHIKKWIIILVINKNKLSYIATGNTLELHR